MVKILFLGDVVGRPGRRVLTEHLHELQDEFGADLTIVNGENSAGGLGIDPGTAREILEAGAQVITTGNHVWNRKEFQQFLNQCPDKVIRPHNFPDGAPGKGCTIATAKNGTRVGVVNLIGRVFMTDLVDCPFRAYEKLVDSQLRDVPVRFLDFHGEATSEKVAFGFFADGQASVVVGTHTHVQTSDERLFPQGTAYITDVGMCGPYESVIGVEPQLVVQRFLSGRPARFDVAKGPAMINAIIAEVAENGRALSIARIRRVYED